MNKALLLTLSLAAIVGPLSAHAQLTSADHGAAATDGNGLMWANTIGTNLSWSSTGGAGTAQAWIANLNATDYGGFNNWTLATGDGSVQANIMSNQLGELFYKDCGNSLGTSSVLNNSGKSCTALSALNNLISTPQILFSSSQYAPLPGQGYFWVYQTPKSVQEPWNNDTSFNGAVGVGDAVAVRAAPEIDPSCAASFGCLVFWQPRGPAWSAYKIPRTIRERRFLPYGFAPISFNPKNEPKSLIYLVGSTGIEPA